MSMEAMMSADRREDSKRVAAQAAAAAEAEAAKSSRSPRKSRSVLLHGYGGAALRVFGTYVVDDDGKPRNIIVRAYHKESAGATWQPSDATTHSTVEEMEDEIADWQMRATSIGYQRMAKRIGARGVFNKDAIPAPPKAPKPGVFTKGGMPGPLSVKHGGGGGGRGRR